MIEWSDIKFFLAIVRSGSFSSAAESLKVSRPTVSRRLQVLEKALGQVLFQRTGEGMLITAEGEAILPMALSMEENALALIRTAASIDERLHGPLKITCAQWFASYILPSLLVEFSKKFPGVDVEVLSGSNMLDLSRREADIAFRNVPFEQADIVQRKLMQVPYSLYAAEHYPLINMKDGDGMKLILMNEELDYFPDVSWIRKRFPKARSTVRCNDRVVQAQLCALGQGLAILPVAVGHATPGLKVVELEESPPERNLWLGYHRDLRNLKRLRELINMLSNARL